MSLDQQRQQEEERRRREEELAAMTYEQRRDYYFANPPDTCSPYSQNAWMKTYDARHDTCVDGRPLMRQTANGPEMTEHQQVERESK